METDSLIPHLATPPLAIRSIAARITAHDPNWLAIRWRIEGASQLVVPPFAGKGRADELWRTTCFELFVRPDGGDCYCEFNLSPSERWAAYDFSAYRKGMAERVMPRDPICTLRKGGSVAIFDAAIPAVALPALPARYALTAVIEENGGHKSYWAASHPPGRPDFHDPACFTGRLAAPDNA